MDTLNRRRTLANMILNTGTVSGELGVRPLPLSHLPHALYPFCPVSIYPTNNLLRLNMIYDPQTDFNTRFRTRPATSTKLSTQVDIHMDARADTHTIDEEGTPSVGDASRPSEPEHGSDDDKYRAHAGDELYPLRK